MLECYFDDSGTHDDSRIVLWGGVIGSSENFVELDRRWHEVLNCPADGKPPIRKFHLYDCVHGRGAFEGYEPAARDLARNRFRTAVVKSGVALVACGVDVAAWNALVVGNLRRLIGTAERCAFGKCVESARLVADREAEEAKVYIDEGRREYVANVVEAVLSRRDEIGPPVHAEFVPVSSKCGLQAADIVAYEIYTTLDSDPMGERSPGPHAFDLVRRAESIWPEFMGRQQIQEMVDRLQPMVLRFEQTGELP